MEIIKHLKQILQSLRLPEEDDEPLSEGEKIWDKLTKDLPPAVGNITEDHDRLRLFKNMAAQLSADQLEALKAYLAEEVEWYKEEPDPAVPKTLTCFNKWYKIYRLHLEALM